MHPSSKNVAITGLGCVSCLGNNLQKNVENIQHEISGISQITRISVHRQKTFYAGSVQLEDSKSSQLWNMIKLSINEAIDDAQLTKSEVKKLGIFIGTTTGAIISKEEEDINLLKQGFEPTTDLEGRGVGQVANEISAWLDTSAPVITYSTACTSSAVAMLCARQAILTGKIERALIVGVETLCNLILYGFRSLMLYDNEKIRPFDLHRNGLQLGEASSAIILEKSSLAGDKVNFSLVGGEIFQNNIHMTAPSPDGSDVKMVMKNACQSANITPQDIIAIKAHGTASIDNDLAEGKGILGLYEGSTPPAFVSLKGYFGHTLGASATLETAAYLGCLKQGFLPKSHGFSTKDPDIGISPSCESMESKFGHYLFSNFGFGGSMVSYVIKYHAPGEQI